jgi:serine/threonine protein kinase
MTEWEGLEIEGRLGVGSTGTVWLARQLSVGRRVAVKELAGELAGDEVVRAGLRQEARVLARLEHPNCVAVYSYGPGAVVRPPSLRRAVSRRGCGGAPRRGRRCSGRRLVLARGGR